VTFKQKLIKNHNAVLKNSLTPEQRKHLNLLIYALHRINDGRVNVSELNLMLIVKEFRKNIDT